MRPHQTALLLAGLVSLAGLFLPPLGAALLPLAYLNTHLHELAHALAAVGTGGSVERIQVYGNAEGLTLTRGGLAPLVASAGYLGAAAWGAAIVLASRTERGARLALGATGAILALSMLLFVRGDAVGEVSGFVWAAALLAAGWRLRGAALLFAAGLVGLQQGLNALRSLFELFQITAASERFSDARGMEAMTHVPAIVWSLLWGLCGLAVVALTARRAWAPLPPSASRRAG